MAPTRVICLRLSHAVIPGYNVLAAHHQAFCQIESRYNAPSLPPFLPIMSPSVTLPEGVQLIHLWCPGRLRHAGVDRRSMRACQ